MMMTMMTTMMMMLMVKVIIEPMYLNAVSAMGVGIIKPWKIVSPIWHSVIRMVMMRMMMMMVFDDSHDNHGDNDDHLYFSLLIRDNSNIS